MIEPLGRRVAAEAVGSLLLAAGVIGSGIMGERLAAGSAAIALLANTAATVAILAVIIRLFAPISGAHFNPVVSFILALRGQIAWREGTAYGVAQVGG
ncbi:MAG TPA: aquaporin, partial [Steroidobacteraceae bacterium]|nr:aquaporin [Steroidobacteraceae bacterium]